MTNTAVKHVASVSTVPRPRRMRMLPLVILAATSLCAGMVFFLPAPGSSFANAVESTEAKLVKAYPHDATAFCQGLVVYRGQLLEGTGQYGRSRLRLVELESGVPDVDVPLANDVFGEGVTVWKDQIIQLTWQNGYLIVYDAATFKRTGTVAYRDIDASLKEGWGLTHDGTHLILSDGTSLLRFIDPETWRVVKSMRVKSGLRSLSRLNELEYVNGEIFANVWYQDRIARIDPESGRVTGWLDVSALRPRAVRRNREAVLNGIAWDAEQQRLFVTGKHWPNVFEIRYDGGR
ncbi:MAG: glutaminyl-peptide cyclotransferase [Planctomycetaceae bacterium]